MWPHPRPFVILWFAGGAFIVVWAVFRDPAIDYRLVMAGAVLPDLGDGVLGSAGPMHTLSFAAGLLQDVAGGGLVGGQALTKALLGFALGGLGPRLRVTQPLVQVPGLVLLSIVEGLARYALLKLFHFPASFGELMTYVVLPQALYNGFIGAAVVLVLAWTEAMRDRAA